MATGLAPTDHPNREEAPYARLRQYKWHGTVDALASIQGIGVGNDHVQLFRNPPVNNEYISLPGEFSTLMLNSDSIYTQRTKIGTLIQFDVTGKETSVTDRNGNTTTYAYDGQDRLLTITDPANLVTTFEYDKLNRSLGCAGSTDPDQSPQQHDRRI